MKNKIIVILGPTSSGKTGLAVKLAHKYHGEIISADSRQVYKGMDIGTGKDLGEYEISGVQHPIGCWTPMAIPHHLIDVVKPKTEFSLGKFKKKAEKAIEDVLKRGKLPIIAGGTGLYLQALVDNYDLSSVKPDKKLRARLEKKSAAELLNMLKKLDSMFVRKMHESDKKNKRRLVRYIEQSRIATNKLRIATNKSPYDFLLIGLKWPRDVLRKRIYKRLVDRLEKEGMVDEVKRLKKEGVSWKRLESFGLEYKHAAWYLQGKLEYSEMVEKLNIAIGQFAKRQMSWFRRWERQGAKIYWVRDKKDVEKLIKKFLK